MVKSSPFIPSVLASFLNAVTSYHRSKLFKAFLEVFQLDENSICLDVGGVSEGFEGLTQFCNGVSVNLEVRKRKEGWDLLIGDARNLPFKDKGISVCISNSVIEHVACGKKEFARELERVSKNGYFISTPYYYTPFEPHYFLPFFQFVPETVKKFLLFKIGLRIGWMSEENYHEIGLFKKKDLKLLFPKASIKVFKVLGIPTNLIACASGRVKLGYSVVGLDRAQNRMENLKRMQIQKELSR